MRVLVATDIAARGLDIAQLPLVVNFDLPLVAEDYVTALAGPAAPDITARGLAGLGVGPRAAAGHPARWWRRRSSDCRRLAARVPSRARRARGRYDHDVRSTGAGWEA